MEERRGKEKKTRKRSAMVKREEKVQDGQFSQVPWLLKKSPWFGKAFGFYLDYDINPLESLEKWKDIFSFMF